VDILKFLPQKLYRIDILGLYILPNAVLVSSITPKFVKVMQKGIMMIDSQLLQDRMRGV
jgi:hypothetical protein